MLAIREKLKPLTENGISGARKLGTDLTMTDSGEFLEKINFRDLPDNTFVMGEQEGMFQTCDLDQTLCFTVCGSGKTGKTNFLKFPVHQKLLQGGFPVSSCQTDEAPCNQPVLHILLGTRP